MAWPKIAARQANTLHYTGQILLRKRRNKNTFRTRLFDMA